MIDIVASEQGPSCSSLQQVPDLKLIHVRFVTKLVSTTSDDKEFHFPCIPRKKRTVFPIPYEKVGERSSTLQQPNSCSQMDTACSNKKPELASTASGGVSSVYPKSLSIVNMLRLGK